MQLLTTVVTRSLNAFLLYLIHILYNQIIKWDLCVSRKNTVCPSKNSYNERKKDYEYMNILNISISQILTTKGETTCVTNKKTKSLY